MDDDGFSLIGKKFKERFGDVFYKWVEEHDDLPEGLNIDKMSITSDDKYRSGGFVFINGKDINNYIKYGKYIRKVIIPDEIILGNKIIDIISS